VFISFDNTRRLTERLEAVVKAESFHEWTDKEINSYQMRSNRFKRRLRDDSTFAEDLKALPVWTPTPKPPPAPCTPPVPAEYLPLGLIPPQERATATPSCPTTEISFCPATTTIDSPPQSEC
jgi:hypothetical protein